MVPVILLLSSESNFWRSRLTQRGKNMRRLFLADAAIIRHGQAGELARLNGKLLLCRKRKRRTFGWFGMKDEVTRCERDLEIALFVRLELDYLFALQVTGCLP